MSNLQKLFQTMPQVGTLQWIGIRPTKKADLIETEQIDISIEEGLIGDHYQGRNRKRQITLIQAEHLTTIGSVLKREPINPLLVRRNIVVSGINLLALKNQQFQIGNTVILEMTGLCHPCSRMEENLGAGGYNAMRGHGGITAKVIQGGIIKKGDPLKML